MPLSPEWVRTIDGFLRAQRAAGLPETTIYTRRQHLENLGRGVEATGPNALGPAQLRDWVGDRQWAQETRRGRRTTFRAFWRYLLAEGLVHEDATALLPIVRPALPDPRPVPEADYQDALSRADERTRLILRLARELGLRRAEIARIHSRDIVEDLLGWSLRVLGKGAKPRTLPLPPRLALELRALPEGFAFPGAIDGHLSPRRVGELATEALPGDWTIHKLRHRALQDWYDDSEGDVLAVQELAGHASADTTRRYVKPRQDRLRRLVLARAS
jgi:integrase